MFSTKAGSGLTQLELELYCPFYLASKFFCCIASESTAFTGRLSVCESVEIVASNAMINKRLQAVCFIYSALKRRANVV